MNDCIDIGTWEEAGIEIDDGLEMGVSVEGGFDIMVEVVADDESEIHLIVGDIVEESAEEQTAYDFGMEFSDPDTFFVYVGPELPAVDASWSTDAWFLDDGWFDSEGW